MHHNALMSQVQLKTPGMAVLFHLKLYSNLENNLTRVVFITGMLNWKSKIYRKYVVKYLTPKDKQLSTSTYLITKQVLKYTCSLNKIIDILQKDYNFKKEYIIKKIIKKSYYIKNSVLIKQSLQNMINNITPIIIKRYVSLICHNFHHDLFILSVQIHKKNAASFNVRMTPTSRCYK